MKQEHLMECVDRLLDRIARERSLSAEPAADQPFGCPEWSLVCLQDRVEEISRLLDLNTQALSFLLLLRQEQRS